MIAALHAAAEAATNSQVNIAFIETTGWKDGFPAGSMELLAEARWEDACRRCWQPISTGNVEESKFGWGLLWEHGCGRHNSPTAATLRVGGTSIERGIDAAFLEGCDTEEEEAAEAVSATMETWADGLVAEVVGLLRERIREEQEEEAADVKREAAELLNEFVANELAGMRYVDKVEDALAEHLSAEEHEAHLDPATGAVTFYPNVRFEAIADYGVTVTAQLPPKLVERDD